MSTSTTFIYGLCDPITQQLRYIGKANNPEVRCREHLSARFLRPKTHKNHWIKSLLGQAVKPEPFVIEEVPSDGWQEAERFWIAYFRSIGADLTNLAPGGEGDCGPEGRARHAAAMRGRKANRTPEHQRKIVEINKARAADPEWRRKITVAAKVRAERDRGTLMTRLKVAWFAPRTKRYELSCPGCGVEFVATNTRKKYCTRRCGFNSWRRVDRKRRKIEVVA